MKLKNWQRKLHKWRIRREYRPSRASLGSGGSTRPMRTATGSPSRGIRLPASRTSRKSGWPIPKRYIAFLMLLLAIVAFVHSYYRFDRMILPLVLEVAEIHLQTEINNAINQVVNEIISEQSITALDFIVKHNQPGASGPVLSVNTVLVNEICNAVAMRISEWLNNLEPEVVDVPMGMAFGLDTLAQSGPRFSFQLAPIGNALVDYESRFSAVGINQTHFSVWLTVESEVRIINPVHSSTIYVNRHVSLVDTIISGVVPDTYLNMDTPLVNIN